MLFRSIQQAHLLLAPLLGTSVASVAFAIALLASGQSSTLTGTMAGQIIMEGFLDFRMRPWLRRLITRAIAIVPAGEIGTFLHATFESTDGGERELITTALGASPGAASGVIVLTAEDAIDAADAGKAVILVRNETTPDDVLGMQSSRGILTTRGGITSHAAVVARGWGIPAVVGAGELVIDDDGVHIGDRVIAPGTEISIDGRTGEVFLGAASTSTIEAPGEQIGRAHV